MIARLSGTVAEKGADHAILDVAGVGYLVHLSAVTLARLPPQGNPTTLRTFTNVRQDAIELFGFATEDEESVFRALIDVKGVGPRAAQNILSGIDAKDLAAAVAQGDHARLTKVPGIGKKTAERLVVELREKLAVLARAAGPAKAARDGDALEQLRQALVNLGYKAPQADGAVDRLRDDAEGKRLDDLLRDALKLLRG
ncbi:MAG TPA: Holliday junction branch migration protein RuvA [Anaeromyxobacter sp.]